MVAIPDFAAGAMENYGLVTYRETALLYDESHSAASDKQRVPLLCFRLFRLLLSHIHLLHNVSLSLYMMHNDVNSVLPIFPMLSQPLYLSWLTR
jgi:hypothetical protein